MFYFLGAMNVLLKQLIFSKSLEAGNMVFF